MSLFKGILSANESLFKNRVALDYDYVPKVIPYREQQQRYIASCISPLFQNHNGKNIVIHGRSGIGKTLACKHIFQEIEEETDEVIPLYVNCWQKNTSYKVLLEMCEALGYRLTFNKKTDELFRIIKGILNKKSAVFCFDEADKLEDFDFLYNILEEIYRKTVILITNYPGWVVALDGRIKSRLTPDTLEFKPYNRQETYGVLKERHQHAFHADTWEQDALMLVAEKSYELEDVRSGLFIMKEAALIAESYAGKKVTQQHVRDALKKIDEFTIKNSGDLDDEQRTILQLAKEHSGKKIGELYRLYQGHDGKSSYKTFQRKIAKLAENKFVELEKVMGGSEGNSTIIRFIGETRKKEAAKTLAEF
jgi:archaeal cell division control protein 6